MRWESLFFLLTETALWVRAHGTAEAVAALAHAGELSPGDAATGQQTRQEQVKHGILEEKKAALIDFEKDAKNVLADSIREKYSDELEGLKEYLATTREEQKTADARAKELTLLIAKKYEPYLGKESLSLDIIDQMETRLDSGASKTIGEALKQVQEALRSSEASVVGSKAK